jgi:hypothetical protein
MKIIAKKLLKASFFFHFGQGMQKIVRGRLNYTEINIKINTTFRSQKLITNNFAGFDSFQSLLTEGLVIDDHNI